MKKVIKIKESDLRKIAQQIIKEQETNIPQPDDFDTQIQPEEIFDEDELTLAQDEQGVFYVLKNAKNGTPEVVAKTN